MQKPFTHDLFCDSIIGMENKIISFPNAEALYPYEDFDIVDDQSEPIDANEETIF
jgi:hypothetical protein